MIVRAVSLRIIDGLEVVDVDERDGERLSVRRARAALRSSSARTAGVDAGERIACGVLSVSACRDRCLTSKGRQHRSVKNSFHVLRIPFAVEEIAGGRSDDLSALDECGVDRVLAIRRPCDLSSEQFALQDDAGV